MTAYHKLFPAVLFLALLPLTACALSGKAIEGKVVEQGTHKPIPNAIVIARWHGTVSALVDAQTVCVHVESATTDAQGNYRLLPWRKSSTMGPVFDVQPIVTAHKPGYRLAEEYPETTPRLVPFTGTRGERLKYLLWVLGTTSCGAQDESEKNLISLRKALYEEALKLAQTKEDQKTVEAIRYDLEILELGFKTAEQRHLERVQKK